MSCSHGSLQKASVVQIAPGFWHDAHKIRAGANGPSSRSSGRVQQLRSCSDRCAPPRSHELKRLGRAVLTACFESQERLSSGGSCGVVVSQSLRSNVRTVLEQWG